MFLTRTSIPTVLFCLWALPAHAQPKPTVTKPEATKLTTKQMQAMVAEVLRETSALRELKIKKSVPSSVYTRKQLREMLNGLMDSSVPSDEVKGAEIFIKQLGLAPADFDLRSYYLSMMGEQIAGAYDTQTKKFFTVEGIDPMQLRTIMAHELTHALQDQHFDLSRMEKWQKHDSDAHYAMKALVEGDATFTMMRYTAKSPFRSFGMAISGLKQQNSAGPLYQKAPRIIRESVAFPYIYGMSFVSNLHRSGGWELVSGAFKKLPASTEQVMHPEKYHHRDAPVAVPLRDLTTALGKGWKLMDHDVNGEFGLFLVVAEHLKDDGVAAKAAEGWGGDRYAVYQGPKKSALVVQDCVWDTDQDALEWAQAYARTTNNRLKIQPQQRGIRQVWSSGGSGIWLERRGRRVLILEGTVGAFNVDQVLPILWRNPKPATSQR